MKLQTISPKDCNRWDLADRAVEEFGDIFELAEDIRKNGQVEPVIVRPISGKDYKYEIVAGSRRWKACFETDQPLLAIIKEMSDTEAMVAQIRENEKRKLSDYSKGMHYHKLISANVTNVTELAKILGITRAKLYGFLDFARIPEEIWLAIGKRKERVSSRTARTIAILAQKGEKYQQAIINLAEEIRLGAGSNTLERLVEKQLLTSDEQANSEDNLIDQNNEIIAKWKYNTLTFDRNIKLNKKKINKMLLKILAKKL